MMAIDDLAPKSRKNCNSTLIELTSLSSQTDNPRPNPNLLLVEHHDLTAETKADLYKLSYKLS